jgi:hypothetical protein
MSTNRNGNNGKFSNDENNAGSNTEDEGTPMKHPLTLALYNDKLNYETKIQTFIDTLKGYNSEKVENLIKRLEAYKNEKDNRKKEIILYNLRRYCSVKLAESSSKMDLNLLKAHLDSSDKGIKLGVALKLPPAMGGRRKTCRTRHRRSKRTKRRHTRR